MFTSLVTNKRVYSDCSTLGRTQSISNEPTTPMLVVVVSLISRSRSLRWRWKTKCWAIAVRTRELRQWKSKNTSRDIGQAHPVPDLTCRWPVTDDRPSIKPLACRRRHVYVEALHAGYYANGMWYFLNTRPIAEGVPCHLSKATYGGG